MVAVTDDGANLVKDARVLFEVTKGGGQLSGVGSTEFGTTYETVTDSDGRATAEYKLGFAEGSMRSASPPRCWMPPRTTRAIPC
ncbi:MAG: hypothetical protein IPG64_01885 [Haliea sp.]|nr:hypothetical protein [Haliea sp.]